jgi:uncharacterized membrane protein (DUF4010 family)
LLLNELLSQIWFHFLLVALFGFLTGLELREYLLSKRREGGDSAPLNPGSARTYTYIAILGFVLHLLDPGFHLYLAGMLALVLFFALYYQRKLQQGAPGLLRPLIALVVYSYGPAIDLQPPWFLVLLFVATVFTLNARPLTHRITETIDRGELLTLAKFLLLAAVILPLMPDRPVVPQIPTTPYKIWVAVVAISAISYLGYILQRYVFPNQGYLVTGLLGGLYSSTATTVVLARRLRVQPDAAHLITLAILAASGMMYLRLLALILILNTRFLSPTLPPFLLLGMITIGYTLIRFRKGVGLQQEAMDEPPRNPLELGTAFLFAALFIVMLVLSQWVLHRFGNAGLQVLSFSVGFTDIDPFVLSLLKGDYHAVPLQQLAAAMVVAAGSNNFLKAVYATAIGGLKEGRAAFIGLILLGVLTTGYGLFMAW